MTDHDVYHFTFKTKNYNNTQTCPRFFLRRNGNEENSDNARAYFDNYLPTARRLCFVWQHASPYGERKPVQYGAMIKSAANLSFNSNESKHDKQNERSGMRNV